MSFWARLSRRLLAPFRILFVRWLVIMLIGIVVELRWLDPMLEPSAVAFLYPHVPRVAHDPGIRVLDVSPLYHQTAGYSPGGHLPAASVRAFLDATANLPPEEKPAAIGLDLPIVSTEKAPNSGISVNEDQKAMLYDIDRFVETYHIPVRIGIRWTASPETTVRTFCPDLKFPKRFASSLNYNEHKSTPLYFGVGETEPGRFLSLGMAVIEDANGGPKSSHPALTPRYHIEPPEKELKEIPAAWIYVDPSLLADREAFTVSVGEEIGTVFSEEAHTKLQHSRSRKMVWFVGVTEVPEREDIFTFDPHSHWLSEGEPIRRIYEHAAVAYTYRDAPLRRLEGFEAISLDIACALVGLLFVVWLEVAFEEPKEEEPEDSEETEEPEEGELPSRGHRLYRRCQPVILALGCVPGSIPYLLACFLRGFRRPVGESGGELVEVLGAVVLVPLPIVVSYFLAGRHILWLGFFATTAYALIEPIASGAWKRLSQENPQEEPREEPREEPPETSREEAQEEPPAETPAEPAPAAVTEDAAPATETPDIAEKKETPSP